MMEGRGVTNYDPDKKPSYGYSSRTTEFDDALIQRGIVTLEQVFMAKGMSEQQAQRMAQHDNNVNKRHAATTADDDNELNPKEEDEEEEVAAKVHVATNNESESEEEEDEDSEDDDEFLKRYRRQRLQELTKQQQQQQQFVFGEVIFISRPDWTREVNEASCQTWVVVVLTSQHDMERTRCMEQACQTCAAKFGAVKFVSIPSCAAIPNWPDHELPTLFLYKDGKLQKELVRLAQDITAKELEWTLAKCQVLKTTTLQEAPATTLARSRKHETCTVSQQGYGGSSVFGGTMMQLKTKRHDSDDDDDEDYSD